MRTAANRSTDRAFTVVEIIIAMLLLSVAVGGVVALASSSNKSTSLAAVRDTQAGIMESVAEKIRADSSWTNGSGDKCTNFTGAPINITSWVNTRAARELEPDPVRGTTFRVQATARAVDSPTDGACPNDKDGVVPDYHEVEITLAPDVSTRTRFPNLGPMTEIFQVDFSNRVAGGRLIIQACYVTPQIDMRVPLGSCSDTDAEPVLLLPPTQSKMSNGTFSCNGDFDCTAWECTNPLLHAGCSEGQFGHEDFITIYSRPSVGWNYHVSGADPNTQNEMDRFGSLNAQGMAELDHLTPGRYKVEVTPAPGYVEWSTHSVPASGVATVERGIRSRIVQLFRPARRTDPFTIDISTKDVSNPPWIAPIEYDYYAGGNRELSLVPGPVGRIPQPATVKLESGMTEMTFTDVEPGLYTSFLANDRLTTKYQIRDTPGFIYIPPTVSGDPIVPAEKPRVEFIICDHATRSYWVNLYGEGTVVEYTNSSGQTVTWEATYCGGPPGPAPPPPPPANGGGGSS